MNQSAQLDHRTCRCCGRSITFSERQEVDSFKEGLDVCPGCLLHFNRKSCLYGAPSEDEIVNDTAKRMRRELMEELWT